MPTNKPQRLTFTEADARLDGRLERNFQGSYDSVLLFEGPVKVAGDFLAAVHKLDKTEADLIVIHGDLTVDGPIRLYESMPGLLVTGFTRADTLEGGDCEIYIGEGAFKYLVYGYYNDGTLETGKVKTPWVINSNHELRVSADDAHWVDNYGDDDECDFTSRNIAESFVPEVLGEEADELDVDAFVGRLRAGKAVLKAGAKTVTDKSLENVAGAKKARVTALDLTDKKLKKFPADVLEMPWLKKLVLDSNDIKSIPKGIAKLVELEELSLVSCDLSSLPDEIGTLTSLRVLRIGSNIDYEFSGDERKASALELPSTIGGLVNLEELDVSELSAAPEEAKEALPELSVYKLPASAAKLKKLRRLIADGTNLSIPAGMHALPGLEEVRMSGGSSAYIKTFPEWVLTFPSLRKLDLSGNFFTELPSAITKLANLEELDLTNAMGRFKKPLPNLSALRKLRVLKLSGNTPHTGVTEPPHSVLRPLFSMKLDALEELAIDRWGEETEKTKRPPMPASLLSGIGRFRALKKLDLSFNDLKALPDDFFKLAALEEVDLRYNKLGAKERKRIAAALPRTRVDLRDQDVPERTKKRTGAAAKVYQLIEEANTLRGAESYDAALEKYAQAIARFDDGSVDAPYDQLYAHYGRMWIHGKRGYGKKGSAAEREKWRKAGVAEAETCMKLVPPVWQIFQFTDEGAFQRETVRYATNFIAWELQANRKATASDLSRALELIEHGAACVEDAAHHYVLDTQVRVLLKLGRHEDAWRLVQKVLHTNPDFDALEDLKKDERYVSFMAHTDWEAPR